MITKIVNVRILSYFKKSNSGKTATKEVVGLFDYVQDGHNKTYEKSLKYPEPVFPETWIPKRRGKYVSPEKETVEKYLPDFKIWVDNFAKEQENTAKEQENKENFLIKMSEILADIFIKKFKGVEINEDYDPHYFYSEELEKIDINKLLKKLSNFNPANFSKKELAEKFNNNLDYEYYKNNALQSCEWGTEYTSGVDIIYPAEIELGLSKINFTEPILNLFEITGYDLGINDEYELIKINFNNSYSQETIQYIKHVQECYQDYMDL